MIKMMFGRAEFAEAVGARREHDSPNNNRVSIFIIIFYGLIEPPGSRQAAIVN